MYCAHLKCPVRCHDLCWSFYESKTLASCFFQRIKPAHKFLRDNGIESNLLMFEEWGGVHFIILVAGGDPERRELTEM